MIRKVCIKNFQSHKNSVFEFSPGLNVFGGFSDSGKSSALSALRWLFWGQPTGPGIVNHSAQSNAEDCSVRVEFENEKLAATKIKKANETCFHYGSWFRSCARENPVEIDAFFRMNSVSYQAQFFPPFLLSDSPGQVASFFNSFTNLSKIDLSISTLRKIISNIEKEIGYDEKQLQQVQQEMDQFDDLPIVDKMLTKAEEIEYNISRQEKEQESIKSIIDQIERINQQTAAIRSKNTHRIRMQIRRAQDIEKNGQPIKQEIEQLKKVVEKMDRVQQEIAYVQKSIKQNTKEFNRLMPNVCPLCGR